MENHTEIEILEWLNKWGKAREDVRAIILTSSRSNPNAQIDRFSDYDPILVVTDIKRYIDDRWLGDFGKVLTVYRDPIRIEYGFERFTRVTQYEDGLKIDFSVWPVGLLKSILELPALPDYLDIGYRVILDKDKLTVSLKAPTYKAYIPVPPTESEYLTLIEEHLSEANYVAKHLCRGDLIPAKYILDTTMKFEDLRKMLEWQMEIEHNWSIKPGAYGKGLQKYIKPEIWDKLVKTYVGTETEENWKALFATIDLFREVAEEVGKALGYTYPVGLYERSMQYLKKIKID